MFAYNQSTKTITGSEWANAREYGSLYKASGDVWQHAKSYYAKYPSYPPDGFDIINLKTRKHYRNRSSADWMRVHNAFDSHYSFLQRLLRTLSDPTFLTVQLQDLGFKPQDSSYRNYQDHRLLGKIREVLKKKIQGAFWWRVEVGINGVIHVHIICDRDSYRFKAYAEKVFDPMTLYRYLIKGIPYNAENLAIFWLGKSALPALHKKRLCKELCKIRSDDSFVAVKVQGRQPPR
jgi:hypothetical protein